MNAKINAKVLILCTMNQGAPPFSIEWMKDGKLLQSDDHIKIHQVEEYSTLSIKSTKESDAGNYTCHAKNSYGSDSFTTRLVIQGKVKAGQFKQLIVKAMIISIQSTTNLDA